MLHQMWVGSPIPDRYREWGEQLQAMHPDWEYRLWGDDDFGWLQNQHVYDQAERLVVDHKVGQLRFGIDGNTFRIQPAGQFRGIKPVFNGRNLRGREGDHPVSLIVLEIHVEIVKITARRTNDDHVFSFTIHSRLF
jgi:hypothetical protein